MNFFRALSEIHDCTLEKWTELRIKHAYEAALFGKLANLAGNLEEKS